MAETALKMESLGINSAFFAQVLKRSQTVGSSPRAGVFTTADVQEKSPSADKVIKTFESTNGIHSIELKDATAKSGRIESKENSVQLQG